VWGAILLALAYFGPNKLAFEGIRGLDEASFAQALTYSLVDAAMEMLLFVILSCSMYTFLGVRAIPAFAMYVKAANMVKPFAAVCALVPILSVSFFLEHTGVDATFRFAWLRDCACTNATEPCCKL
jgi:hypothetical protein